MLNSGYTGRTELARTPQPGKYLREREYDTGLQNCKWLDKTVTDSFTSSSPLRTRSHKTRRVDPGSKQIK